MLRADYAVAVEEENRANALWNEAWAATRRADAAEAEFEAADAALYAASNALEAVVDMIVASPCGSVADLAFKAEVLFWPGANPADLFYRRPQDLTRFVHDVSSLAQL